jgi:hypothetical protein
MHFFDKMEGLNSVTVFLAGRTVVLGELLMGWFDWGPGSHSRGSIVGQLVIDSRLSVANPYSSWACLTGLRGSLPSCEGKPWIMYYQDSNTGWDGHSARAPRCWPLAGPSLSTPHSKGCPRAVVEPIDGPAFKLLGLDGS